MPLRSIFLRMMIFFSKTICVAPVTMGDEYDGNDYYELSAEQNGNKLGILTVDQGGRNFSFAGQDVLSGIELTRIFVQITAHDKASSLVPEDFPCSLDEFYATKLIPFTITA